MNYLAHFYLSGYKENLIIGNYIADDVKGKAYLDYPNVIQEGILLHRKIDNFTDNHAEVHKSKELIRTHQNKFTPVVMDVFYDYFLAKDWRSHSKEDLTDFTHFIYKTLFKNINYLPLKSQLRLPFMAKSNWLLNYREIKGIERALIGMSKRTKYTNNMSNAHEVLKENEVSLEENFNQFFPDLKSFVQEELNDKL